MLERSKKALKHARSMRRTPTASENKLWLALRNRRLNGLKFSRQVPIGSFIADFVCRERMLIIEVDGATHGDAHEVKRDETRSEFLKSQGYRIHRVWSRDVYENLDGVRESILLLLNGLG
jgi:very-short-patch-repair endonuclease